MRLFVESLKRLYTQQKVSREQLEEYKTLGKITQGEFDYITA